MYMDGFDGPTKTSGSQIQLNAVGDHGSNHFTDIPFIPLHSSSPSKHKQSEATPG
jgi:hypothetical protein